MGIDIFRIANGKIVEQWASPDLLGAAVQLGVISLPEHP
jgi:predicted SnoaL-like aldol condensation-catalyzing enzyme